MYEPKSGILGVAGVGQRNSFFVPVKLQRVSALHTGENFDQSAFTGSVFAHQGMDAARGKVQIDRGERHGTRE